MVERVVCVDIIQRDHEVENHEDSYPADDQYLQQVERHVGLLLLLPIPITLSHSYIDTPIVVIVVVSHDNSDQQ